MARVTEKKVAALAVATVGLVVMLPGRVAAKPSHCPKDCQQAISNCLAHVPKNKKCTGTKAVKKACREMHAAQRKTCRSFVKLCKQQNPSMSGTCLLSGTTTSTLTPVTSTTLATTSGCGIFLTAWGSFGSGNGQFDSPVGVAVDGSGHVFVADSGNGRIQKFDNNGTFLTAWGSFGRGDGQFNPPEGVAVDGSGHVFVADGNGRIQKFDNNGTFLTAWGSFGRGDGQFTEPSGVATDASGQVFVADALNDRIQKFDKNGAFLTAWGSYGSGKGRFGGLFGPGPSGVATDASGQVFVADPGNGRIEKFDNNGTFLTAWGSLGSGNGQFATPVGVAVDGSGHVFVADQANDRIQKFACP